MEQIYCGWAPYKGAGLCHNRARISCSLSHTVRFNAALHTTTDADTTSAANQHPCSCRTFASCVIVSLDIPVGLISSFLTLCHHRFSRSQMNSTLTKDVSVWHLINLTCSFWSCWTLTIISNLATTAICFNFALRPLEGFLGTQASAKKCLGQLCILGMLPCLCLSYNLWVWFPPPVSAMWASLLWNRRSWPFCFTRVWVSQALKHNHFSMKGATQWNPTVTSVWAAQIAAHMLNPH